MGRKRRKRRTEDSIFCPRKHIRIWRRLQFKIYKFIQRSFGKCVAIFLVTIIVISSFMGCSIGRSRAEKKANEAQKILAAKHEKETKKLEADLKKAQRENPEERPWYLALINDTHPMDEGYVPKLAALDDKNEVDERILEPLKQMLDDAQKAGLSMYVCSSYRSVDRQKELYDQYMKTVRMKGNLTGRLWRKQGSGLLTRAEVSTEWGLRLTSYPINTRNLMRSSRKRKRQSGLRKTVISMGLYCGIRLIRRISQRLDLSRGITVM